MSQTLLETLPAHSIVYLRLMIVLAESGPLKSARTYCDALPPQARRYRRLEAQRTLPGLQMHMKEVTDWVLLVRVVSQLHDDRSLEQVLVTLGGCLRTFRRLRTRLRPWIEATPSTLRVADVVEALRRRLLG